MSRLVDLWIFWPIARVIVQAVESGVKWSRASESPRVTVELDPEAPAALAAAFQGGWTALED
jgi:hypothetical protein